MYFQTFLLIPVQRKLYFFFYFCRSYFNKNRNQCCCQTKGQKTRRVILFRVGEHYKDAGKEEGNLEKWYYNSFHFFIGSSQKLIIKSFEDIIAY